MDVSLPKEAKLDLNPLSYEPLHERVYREIKKSLMTGKFVPGHRLPVRTLARALRVSPMPVRAALARLVAQKALESLPTGTVIVPKMTRQRFLDIREARMEVEGLAAMKAAKQISEKALQRLEKLCNELTAATKAGDEELYREKNRQLRFTVYHAANSDTLVDVIEMLWLQVGPFFHYVTRNISIHHEIDYHFDILASLKKRDGKAARKAIQRDTFESGELLLSVGEFSPD